MNKKKFPDDVLKNVAIKFQSLLKKMPLRMGVCLEEAS